MYVIKDKLDHFEVQNFQNYTNFYVKEKLNHFEVQNFQKL